MPHPLSNPIDPGSTLGVLGGGQLGRMLAIAARQLGYRVHVLDPKDDCPTAQCGDEQVTAAYDDLDAVRRFAGSVDVITFEFENVPAATLESIEREFPNVPIHPSPHVLHTCRHRAREKTFLRDAGIQTAAFHVCRSADDVVHGLQTVGTKHGPAILKTAELGYDGKGQIRLTTPDEAAAAWQLLKTEEAVLEAWVPYEREVSVVFARGIDGEFVPFPPIENDHEDGILDVSACPAEVNAKVAANAVEIARTIGEKFELVGVLAVEMFLLQDGSLVVNELAPRPHNSGHLTIDACVTSQFEQQLRAVCHLPLGDPTLLRPAAMANLLGEVWYTDQIDEEGPWLENEPNWRAVFAAAEVKLHLYGKDAPKPGRKMGHLTALADTADRARERVREVREALAWDVERRGLSVPATLSAARVVQRAASAPFFALSASQPFTIESTRRRPAGSGRATAPGTPGPRNPPHEAAPPLQRFD